MVCPPWKTKSWLGVGATPGAIASVSGIDILDRKPFSALVPWPTNTRKGRTCFDLSVFMTLLRNGCGTTGKILRIQTAQPVCFGILVYLRRWDRDVNP